jgi:2,3-dihydroxybenzoate decarboxylase
MKKIAFEEHVSIMEFEQLVAEQAVRLNFPSIQDPDRMANVLGPVMFLEPSEHRIPEMDKYGIDIQVLSIGGTAVQNDLNTARAVANARFANDFMYRIIKQYPGRFYGFGLLAMQDPAAAVQELERCVKELGFVGILLNGATNFSYYDEPQYYPVWAKLEELGVPLYLHVSNPEADQIRMYEGYPELLANTWNWGVVGGTHALRMMFGGVFDRYPGAQLILGHMGESLPYLLGRLDEGYDCRAVKKMGRMAHHPSYYIKNNIYITTSGGFQPEAMVCAIMALGVERILFANDYPHYPLAKTMSHMASCPLTDEQLELIYHGNAERLLRI